MPISTARPSGKSKQKAESCNASFYCRMITRWQQIKLLDAMLPQPSTLSIMLIDSESLPKCLPIVLHSGWRDMYDQICNSVCYIATLAFVFRPSLRYHKPLNHQKLSHSRPSCYRQTVTHLLRDFRDQYILCDLVGQQDLRSLATSCRQMPVGWVFLPAAIFLCLWLVVARWRRKILCICTTHEHLVPARAAL